MNGGRWGFAFIPGDWLLVHEICFFFFFCYILLFGNRFLKCWFKGLLLLLPFKHFVHCIDCLLLLDL